LSMIRLHIASQPRKPKKLDEKAREMIEPHYEAMIKVRMVRCENCARGGQGRNMREKGPKSSVSKERFPMKRKRKKRITLQ